MAAETHSLGLQLHRRASKHQEVSALDLPTALTQAHNLIQAHSSPVGCSREGRVGGMFAIAVAFSMEPPPCLLFTEATAGGTRCTQPAQRGQGSQGRLPPAGWNLLSPEQRGSWAGQGAQHRCWRDWQGRAFQPQEVEPRRLPREPDSLQLQAQVGTPLKPKAR